MKLQHLCLSVRGALRWDANECTRMLAYVAKTDGTKFKTVDELREALMDELAQGHEVIPLGECDNFDWKTGCQGHEVPDEAKDGAA